MIWQLGWTGWFLTWFGHVKTSKDECMPKKSKSEWRRNKSETEGKMNGWGYDSFTRQWYGCETGEKELEIGMSGELQ